MLYEISSHIDRMFYKPLFSGGYRPYQWRLIFLFLSAALLVRLFFGVYFGFCLWYVWLSGTGSTVPDLLTGGTDVLFCHYHHVWRVFTLAVGITAFNKEFSTINLSLMKTMIRAMRWTGKQRQTMPGSLVLTVLCRRLSRRHSGKLCPCLEYPPDRYHEFDVKDVMTWTPTLFGIEYCRLSKWLWYSTLMIFDWKPSIAKEDAP